MSKNKQSEASTIDGSLEEEKINALNKKNKKIASQYDRRPFSTKRSVDGLNEVNIPDNKLNTVLTTLWEETTQIVNNFDTKLYNQLTKKQKAVDNMLRTLNIVLTNNKLKQQHSIDDFRFETEKELREIQIAQLKRQEEEIVKEIKYININEATPEMIEEIRNATNGGEITIHTEMDAEIVDENDD